MNAHQSMSTPLHGQMAGPMRPQPPPAVSNDRASAMYQRLQTLRSQGETVETSNEVRSLTDFFVSFGAKKAAQQNGMNGHVEQPQMGAPPAPTVSFSNDQIDTLRMQITAFKLLSRGQPIPENLQAAINTTNPLAKQENSAFGSPDGPGLEDTDGLPKGPFLEENINSGIYPYNAYRHPNTILEQVAGNGDPALRVTRLQRLMLPSLMPIGLDVNQIVNERDRFIDARIQQRVRELEAIPSTIGEGYYEMDVHSVDPNVRTEAHGKLRAAIELKSLRVLDKQRALRANVAERLAHASLIPLNRNEFRKARKPTFRDARTTEGLERKQRLDREKRAKSKHIEQIELLCAHGKQLKQVTRAAKENALRIGKQVLSFHAQAEREEQKRMEKIAKDRLKALRDNDEDTYRKLIDTAKDTRITHLLNQTDSYLDSLAQAVVAQQNEGGPMDLHIPFDSEDAPASEATFGAHINEDDVQKDKSKVDYYAVAHRISEKVTKQPTLLVGGTLKEYQLKGLQWMVSLYNNRLNGILADEMGLGKTIQTISLITFLIETKKQRGPYLVIVPLSTLTNWSGEFAKWAPDVKLIVYKGNPQQRLDLQLQFRNGFQVLLTTYEYITNIKDRPALSKIKWVHMIIDEGHRMKNTKSKLAVTLTTFYSTRYRLLLTGTPLQNNLPELWALLNFVLPKVFNSVQSFDEWFNTPFASAGTGDKIELNEEEALLIIRRLHKVLRPFLLRRLKKDVESELPDKVEKVIKVRMSALQAQLYKQMKKFKTIASAKNGKPGGVKGLSNELMQLRKICQHPFLFEDVEDKMNPALMSDEKLIRTSGKFELLNRILPKFFATGHRVLIFFQMTNVMNIMEDFLKMMKWKHLRLDGNTKTDERAEHMAAFNKKDSDIKVFILSTRAGGLGLNLQTADTVIIFDSDWNPHADLQAQDRAHRIGQTKAVRILRFITDKSVEEAMYARARYKLDIDDKVIQAGRFDNKSTQEEQEEFLRGILEADQEEENEEAGDMNDEELNDIIARTDEEVVIFREMDVQREREEAEQWKAAGRPGKPLASLMQMDELPDCYINEEQFVVAVVDEANEGRGQRKRNNVSYNDGLSDEAWATALEDGEDLEELQERARERRRAAPPADDMSNRGSPVFSDDEGSSRRGRGGGRKGKAKAEPAPKGKRKRGAKAMSVTPSVHDDDERDTKRRKTTKSASNNGGVEPPASVREKMKKAFAECYKAVLACTDSTGRNRCDLFKELPDRQMYADYYELIASPIAMSHLRKRGTTNYYKTVSAYRDDWRLLFNNARTYNQEGSWVYVDADEMEKVLDAAYDRVMTNSGLPGAPGSGPPPGAYPSARGMDEDERPAPSQHSRSATRRQVVSDDEDFASGASDDD